MSALPIIIRLLAGACLLTGISPACYAQSSDTTADELSQLDKLVGTEKPSSQTGLPAKWQTQMRYSYQQQSTSLAQFQQHQTRQNMSLEFAYHDNWGAQAQAQASILLWSGRTPDTTTASGIGVIKEALLSWRSHADQITELGVITPHYGVAYGYNPNQIYHNYQAHSVNSADPQDLREARAGIIGLRHLGMSEKFAWSWLLIPTWQARYNEADELIYPGRNTEKLALLSFSSRDTDLHATFNSQMLLRWQAPNNYGLGANLSGLLSDASVWHGEVNWTKSERPCQTFLQLNTSFSLPCERGSATRFRYALGANYSFQNKLNLLAELHYDSLAPTRKDWQSWAKNANLSSLKFYEWLGNQLQLNSQRNYFLHLRWDDILPHWTLSAYLQYADGSAQKTAWLQAKYRAQQSELSMQLRRTHGLDWLNSRMPIQQTAWQFSSRWYF